MVGGLPILADLFKPGWSLDEAAHLVAVRFPDHASAYIAAAHRVANDPERRHLTGAKRSSRRVKVICVAETEQQRSKRRRRRTLFDGVAELYAASRPGYPAEIIEFLTATAGVGPGSRVLEVGCGTG